jgi:TonB family protein
VTWISLPVACVLLASQAVVVPTNVPQPMYPPIAQSARVSGDVVFKIVVRPDGSVESAAVGSGAPLLQEAGLKAARLAQYECRGCTQPGTPYSLVFRFRLDEPTPVAGLTFAPEGSATVNVVGEHWLPAGPVAQRLRRVRSAKCLWFWRCGSKPVPTWASDPTKDRHDEGS